jgi:hypothetical protein
VRDQSQNADAKRGGGVRESLAGSDSAVFWDDEVRSCRRIARSRRTGQDLLKILHGDDVLVVNKKQT